MLKINLSINEKDFIVFDILEEILGKYFPNLLNPSLVFCISKSVNPSQKPSTSFPQVELVYGFF